MTKSSDQTTLLACALGAAAVYWLNRNKTLAPAATDLASIDAGGPIVLGTPYGPVITTDYKNTNTAYQATNPNAPVTIQTPYGPVIVSEPTYQIPLPPPDPEPIWTPYGWVTPSDFYDNSLYATQNPAPVETPYVPPLILSPPPPIQIPTEIIDPAQTSPPVDNPVIWQEPVPDIGPWPELQVEPGIIPQSPEIHTLEPYVPPITEPNRMPGPEDFPPDCTSLMMELAGTRGAIAAGIAEDNQDNRDQIERLEREIELCLNPPAQAYQEPEPAPPIITPPSPPIYVAPEPVYVAPEPIYIPPPALDPVYTPPPYVASGPVYIAPPTPPVEAPYYLPGPQDFAPDCSSIMMEIASVESAIAGGWTSHADSDGYLAELYNRLDACQNPPAQAYQVPEPVYVAPEPAYVAPEPVYTPPAPAYVAPEPAYVAPEPIYVPPPTPYVAPEPTYIAPPTPPAEAPYYLPGPQDFAPDCSSIMMEIASVENAIAGGWTTHADSDGYLAELYNRLDACQNPPQPVYNPPFIDPPYAAAPQIEPEPPIITPPIYIAPAMTLEQQVASLSQRLAECLAR